MSLPSPHPARLFVILSLLIAALAGGCANQQAASLGAVPVVRTKTVEGAPLLDSDLRIDHTIPACCTDPEKFLMSVYVVRRDGSPAGGSTNDDYTGLVADVTNLQRHFYLGENPNTADGLQRLLNKRRIIAYRLLEIADRNGDEFWRRFSGLMSYARATKTAATALMGSSIAATFISPVLGASLAGAGLATDAFTSDITAGFDVELYTTLRTSVRQEVENRRHAIINKLSTRSYDDYPATSVVAEICDYAYAYTIRGAMDNLRAAARTGDSRFLVAAESQQAQSVIVDAVIENDVTVGANISWRLPPNMSGLKGVIVLRTQPALDAAASMPKLPDFKNAPDTIAAGNTTWKVISSADSTKLVDNVYDGYAELTPDGKLHAHYYAVVAYDSANNYTKPEVCRFVFKR